MRVWKCKDCNKEISPSSLRCISCSNRNRAGKYVKRGVKHTEEAKRKISEGRRGDKNPAWKGDDVGYKQLHSWIRKYKPKVSMCEICKIKPSEDLSNISKKYKRDINDFWWLCKKCHYHYDSRGKNEILER